MLRFHTKASHEPNIQSTSYTLVPVDRRVMDEEHLHFEPNSLDVLMSCLSLHWVNDLPGTIKEYGDVVD
jgi:hypothetical protein